MVVLLFIVSGAAGLMYQVVWARELALIFGSTSEAISTIVAAFMAGLGFGGLAGGWTAARSARPLLSMPGSRSAWRCSRCCYRQP